jgi:hypothetical protein
MPDVDLTKHAARCAINPPGNYEGPALASAAAITLSHPVHKITGTAAISTINPAFPGFVGHVTLVPLAAATLATGGNIAVARTFVANVAAQLYYDGSTWYPSSVS